MHEKPYIIYYVFLQKLSENKMGPVLLVFAQSQSWQWHGNNSREKNQV